MKARFTYLFLFILVSCGSESNSNLKTQQTKNQKNRTDQNVTQKAEKHIQRTKDALSDSLKNASIRDSLERESTRKSQSEINRSYYYFLHGQKRKFEPPFDLLYIEFNYNTEMKDLSKSEIAELNRQQEKDLIEFELIKLDPRRNIYRITGSKYSRTKLINRLLNKKEVQRLEAVYPNKNNDRYFARTVIAAFKEGIDETKAAQFLKNQGLKHYYIYENDGNQLTAQIEFSARDMLSYRFLLVANNLLNQLIIASVTTSSIQHALPD